MVTPDSACLFLPRETRVSCDANHTQIAKLKRGESGIYPNVKWAIKQALLKAVEEQATVSLSRLQLPSGVAPERPDILRSWHSNSQDLKCSGTPPKTEAAYQANPQTFMSQSGLESQFQQHRMPEARHYSDDAIRMESKRRQLFGPSQVVGANSNSDSKLGPLDNIVSHWQGGIGDPHKSEDTQSLANSSTFAATETASSVFSERIHGLGTSPSEASITSMDTPMGNKVGKPEQISAALNVPISEQHQQQGALAPPASTMQESDPVMQEKLCSAVKEGDVDRVRELLSNGCNVHALSSKGSVKHQEDPFLLAATYRQEQIVKVLLEHGADILKCDAPWSSNVLHWASTKTEGQQPATESFAELLIQSGAPLEARNSAGRTPLAISAMNGIYPNAKCFVADGADIRTRDNDDLMPLHRAAHGDHHKIVALLVSEGAPLEARASKSQYTPLHYTALTATTSGESTKLLLQAGADKEAISGYFSRRAIHMAAVVGNIQATNELIAFGAALDAPSRNNLRALHLAKHFGHWQVVEKLLQGGADPFATRNPQSTLFRFGKTGDRPSKTGFKVGSKVSDADKERCLKLLKDAEAAQPQKKSKAYRDELLHNILA